MGSSNRKKKEKQKDFQKLKLKVGKAKPKASNFTDTGFKAKSIVVNQQGLVTDTSNSAEHFRNQLSFASTARSDNQRRDALAYLTTQASANPPNLPTGTYGLLTKVLPLISDSSTPVRVQLLKLLRALPASEIRPHVEKILMYLRGGMTHLSDEIRDDALSIMEWLLDVAGHEIVSCPGGWMKSLSSFSSMLGWNPSVNSAMSTKGWTNTTKSAVLAKRGPQSHARQIQVLAKFLEVGFKPEGPKSFSPRAHWDNIYRLPTTPHAFAHLNLFGAPRDEEGEMYADPQSRRGIFGQRWKEAVIRGVTEARQEGGAVGRAAVLLDNVLKDCFEGSHG